MSIFLRVWQEVDLKDIEKRLLIIGELSGECFHCHDFKKIGFKNEARKLLDI